MKVGNLGNGFFEILWIYENCMLFVIDDWNIRFNLMIMIKKYLVIY